MTDWTEQVSEFQRSWLEQQQQLAGGCLATLQSAVGTGTPQKNAWCQTIDTMEQQVNSVLDTQLQSLTAMVKIMEQTGNTSFDAQQWEHQAKEGIELWIDTQHRLWNVWFEMLRNASPVRQTPGEMLINNWQDFVDHAVNFQQQWLKGWPSEQSTHDKPAGKRTAKSRKQ